MSTLTTDEIKMLERELARPDLSIYAVCRMALVDVRNGLYSSAIVRLRVDADKLRCYDTPINAFLLRA